MEYEIDDDPQDASGDNDEGAQRDGGIVEDHIALKNQSSVSPDDYPRDERQAQSLVRPKKPD